MTQPDGESVAIDHEALVLRAIGGDADALSSLLETLGPNTRRQVAGKIGHQYRSALDEEDVLQVTYLEAFLRIKQFKPVGPSSFDAWLGRIAQNNLRDAIKGLGRSKRPPRDKQLVQRNSDETYASLLEVLGHTTTTPSRVARRRELKDSVDETVSKLPEDYATVVRLYDLEDRSGPEVATAMNRSRGAIHMLRARAHDLLKEMLGSESRFFTI